MLLYSTYTDEQLLPLLKQGNEAAYTEIYNRYWQRLFFIVHKRIPVAEDAKELLQNIFFTLWDKRAQLEILSLPAYLAAMARYAVYRHLAGEKRREEKLDQLQGITVADTFDLDNKQLLEILTSLTNELPERYRLLFIQHKLLDRPLEEVAAELGISTRTAEGYVTKLMQIMRNYRHKLTVFLL